MDYRSTDAAGNVEAEQSVSFTIQLPPEVQDTVPPVTTIVLDPAGPQGSNGWYTSAVSFRLSATDDRAGVARTEYRIDGGAWTEYAGEASVTVDGSHAVEYRSIDHAGNREAVLTAAFRIDTGLPGLTAAFTPSDPNGTNGWYTTPVSAALTASDSVSGIASVEYRIDGGAWTSYVSPVAYAEDGSHTLDYRAADKAGHVSEGQSSLRIDQTKPVTAVQISPAPDSPGGLYSSDVSVSLSASDSGSGPASTEYRVNGEPGPPTAA
ncbi:hypothetical protein N6H14_14580 [Paenibacillus sp. CC-CFT747]|nr:hypothetical protein N6H14_14580 [Paenibacillus sp. CC-CFT747]